MGQFRVHIQASELRVTLSEPLQPQFSALAVSAGKVEDLVSCREGGITEFTVYIAHQESHTLSRRHITIGTTGVGDHLSYLILQKDILSCGVPVTSQGGILQ